MKVLVVGPGRIGSAFGRLAEEHLKAGISCFSSSSERNSFGRIVREMDLVALTIPTFKNGTIARDLILDTVSERKPIVVGEKSALANHFPELVEHLPRMGISATCGGASGILSLLTSPHSGVESVVGIVNATVNFLLGRVAHGSSPAVALKEAKELGLCERHEYELEKIVRAEIEDMKFKSVIMGKFVCSELWPIRAGDFNCSLAGNGAVSVADSLFSRASTHRFLVTIRRRKLNENVPASFPGFAVATERWVIRGDFTPIHEIDLNVPVPEGRDNALTVRYSDGTFAGKAGIGAGPETAFAMLRDAKRLLGLS